MADRTETQAAKLSEQENWPAAARAWQTAVERFSLLNDPAGEAVARHNLAQAERALGQSEAARANFEQAARLNQRSGRTNEWWRNQIALLQLEAQSNQTQALQMRFEKLLSLAGQPTDRSVRGLFLNELGLWQKTQARLAEAEKSFAAAEHEFNAARNSFGLAVIAANRAELYESQQKYSAARESWKAALKLFQSLADPPGIARCLLGQGRTLLAANQELPEAEDMLRRAANNYKLLKMPKQAQAALELLAQCLAAEGKGGEANSAPREIIKAKNAGD
jgi:tetratricopeptide (TPR) repeat protein